ncbi:hypothetical protein C474_15919 [Halogeometricum pallidum JCM 14848]|uniref:Uncharacterized protein n=1 Tax=Halogeometricum pallidum JCM 14848 TaxID=1227487 RepID=M0CZH0_HALPD|nr:hypothetical protein C474_15919 [Halogeometricum pallidum JCM 14848]
MRLPRTASYMVWGGPSGQTRTPEGEHRSGAEPFREAETHGVLRKSSDGDSTARRATRRATKLNAGFVSL